MTRRRASSHPLLVLLAWSAVLAPVALLRGAEPPPPVSIYFESQVPYVYEDDPIMVALTVKNVTDKTVDNAKGLDLVGGMLVDAARGSKLKAAENLGSFLSQPKVIEQSAFFGRVIDVTQVFPGLKKAGNYKLSWKGTAATSNDLVLHVVERFNPKKDYRVRIETDFGPIVVELAKDRAPRHVRNFVDLVRQGYYNGTQFHRVVPGQSIIGGSQTGDPDSGTGYNLQPEFSDVPVEAGTVLQVRNRYTAPDDSGAVVRALSRPPVDDSGAIFMISAIGDPDLRGKVTILGKVVEGMDTVKTICQVPLLHEQGTPRGAPSRPVKPVLMKKVTATEVTATPEKAPEKGKGSKKGS